MTLSLTYEDEDNIRDINLQDINPTIQALMGTGVNYNNQGFLNKDLLYWFGVKDPFQVSLLEFNNVHQVATLLFESLHQGFFSNKSL